MNASEASQEHTGSGGVFCQGCGSRNDEWFSYCIACGSELEPRREARQDRTRDGGKRSSGDLWSWLGDSSDLMYGQRVLVVARWILVVSGLLLALLNPVVLGELKIQVGLILTLAVANFFLHVQLVRNQPSLPWVAYLASAVDVLAITTMVVTSGGGASSLYVFYFPALFAISVAFRPRAGLVLSGAAIGMYSLIASTQMDGDGGAFVAARIVMMAAVVVCGMMYRKIEGDRRRESGAESERTSERAESEDIYFGQVASNWARWFIIGTGALLILWTSGDTTKLIVGILPVVGLMVMNFYLHGRLLAGRPANRTLIGVAAAVDIGLIMGLILLWPGSTPLGNGLFVMFYPVLLAFAFVMPPRISIGCAVGVIAAYAALTVIIDPMALTDIESAETLIERLITLAAVGLLGAYYWRIQRRRRAETESAAN